MNGTVNLRCRFAVHLSAREDFRQEGGHHSLTTCRYFRSPEGSLQSSKIKNKSAILLPLASKEPSLSSHKSVFVKKSPLVYFLQDSLSSLGQLTKELHPYKGLSIPYCYTKPLNKINLFKTRAKIISLIDSLFLFYFSDGIFLFV